MNGEVAENYGSLIEKLWSGNSSSIAPREFKVRKPFTLIFFSVLKKK